MGKRVDDGDWRTLLLACIPLGPQSLDGRLNRPRADVDLNRVRLWAGNGQHEGSRVSKITLKRNRTGALRELAVECIQLKVHVAELPLYIRNTLGKLDVHISVTGN